MAKQKALTKTLVTAGRPEDRYPVPAGHGAFWLAGDIEVIAQRLIDRQLPDFPECSVTYLWKASGGGAGGVATLGKTVKASGLTEFFAQCDFIVWLGADHVEGMEFTRYQVEALVFHELLHIVKIENEDGDAKAILRGHDFEGFQREIDVYGFWMTDAAAIARSVQGRLALGEVPEAERELAPPPEPISRRLRLPKGVMVNGATGEAALHEMAEAVAAAAGFTDEPYEPPYEPLPSLEEVAAGTGD